MLLHPLSGTGRSLDQAEGEAERISILSGAGAEVILQHGPKWGEGARLISVRH